MTPSASWGAAAALFDHSVYSAITVAWDSSCGGCDNDTTSSTNLAAAKASFVSFFNAVGGITNYYGFLAFFSPGAARVWPSGKPRLVEAGPATAMSATSSQLTVNEPTDFVLVGKNRRELCDAAPPRSSLSSSTAGSSYPPLVRGR